MKSFRLISLLILFVVCSHIFLPKEKVETFFYNTKDFNIFIKDTSTVMCKLEMKFFFKRFNGILFMKRSAQKDYYFVCTTQFGLKIFEFTLKQDNFSVQYCIPSLNKPQYIAMFENQFRLLCGVFKKEYSCYPAPEANICVEDYRNGDTLFRYFWVPNDTLAHFMQFKIKERTRIEGKVLYSKEKKVEGMYYKHKGKGLKLWLKPMENTIINENDSL